MTREETLKTIDSLMLERDRYRERYDQNHFFEDAISLREVEKEIAEIQSKCDHDGGLTSLWDKDKNQYNGCQFCLKNLEDEMLGLK